MPSEQDLFARGLCRNKGGTAEKSFSSFVSRWLAEGVFLLEKAGKTDFVGPLKKRIVRKKKSNKERKHHGEEFSQELQSEGFRGPDL